MKRRNFIFNIFSVSISSAIINRLRAVNLNYKPMVRSISTWKTNKANLNSVIFITDCEFLVAKDGSILVSANQIESHKIKDLPNNIIVLAKTSQLSQTVSKGLEGIRYKYSNNLPSNITSIKNFKRGKDEDLNFLTYGSSAKNLYLILLENL